MSETNMSFAEAYRAMVLFLEAHLERTGSDDIASLLGDLAMRADGSTADPAAWDDWLGAVAGARPPKS